MSRVLDYSVGRPDPRAIVAAGYEGVMRYLAPEQDAAKVIYAPEYASLQAVNLKIGLNWEWYAARAREGMAAGVADAQEALKQANALGYMGAIYFSVDYDAPESDQPAINEYFIACGHVLTLARVGAYGGYWVIKRLFDAGMITYGWQTVAWSGGNLDSRSHLHQVAFGVLEGDADANDVLKDDWLGNAKGSQNDMQLLQHPTLGGQLAVLYANPDGNAYYIPNHNDGAVGMKDVSGVKNLGKPAAENLIDAGGTWSLDATSLNVVAKGASGQLYIKALDSSLNVEMDWTPIGDAHAAVSASQPAVSYDDTAIKARVSALETIIAKIKAIFV